jgi:hypothetical protein
MIRRFNYTGRRKIPRSNIHITVFTTPQGREFEASIHLGDLRLPPEARLFVEAYHKSNYARFDFGTVGAPCTPTDRRLTAFYDGARVLFRVKVVAAGGDGGKIIAEVDQIKPASPTDTRNHDPLLPVRTVGNMEDEIWRLSWSAGPVLELNNKEPQIKTLTTTDPRFKTLILPHVLRSVLIRILSDKMDGDTETEEGRIAARWLEFADALYPVAPPEQQGRDFAMIETWADAAVAAFCRRNRVLDTWRSSLQPRQDHLAI